MADVASHEKSLYSEALARLEQIREAWEEAGRPLVSKGSRGQEIEHPLVKLLRDTELHVHRLGGGLNKGGRPVGAVSAPDRAAPPKLKAV